MLLSVFTRHSIDCKYAFDRPCRRVQLPEVVWRPGQVEIPKFPYDAMWTIYTTEGAAAFDSLTLTGRDKLL
jgi:hypothetical protein